MSGIFECPCGNPAHSQQGRKEFQAAVVGAHPEGTFDRYSGDGGEVLASRIDEQGSENEFSMFLEKDRYAEDVEMAGPEEAHMPDQGIDPEQSGAFESTRTVAADDVGMGEEARRLHRFIAGNDEQDDEEMADWRDAEEEGGGEGYPMDLGVYTQQIFQYKH